MSPRRLLRFHASLFLLPAALAYFASPGEARADFRVCNGTQNLVGVAIGYRASEGWISEGWWQVPATSCATLIEGRLQSRFYYIYAEDAAQGGRWAGEINMCVADNEFKIVGVEDCVARGYQRMPFQEYDTGGQSSWMVQLSDAPPAPEQPSPSPTPPAAPSGEPADAPSPDESADEEQTNEEGSSE